VFSYLNASLLNSRTNHNQFLAERKIVCRQRFSVTVQSIHRCANLLATDMRNVLPPQVDQVVGRHEMALRDDREKVA